MTAATEGGRVKSSANRGAIVISTPDGTLRLDDESRADLRAYLAAEQEGVS